jgi:glutathione peroxidase-family protein
MGKTDVNGSEANPLYEWLKASQPGLLGMKRIKWNFEKFLVGRDGKVKGRWASITKPEALEKPIVDELAKAKSEL